MGLPGAGKTTLARALAAMLGASVVSRDALRLAMFQPCDFNETEKRAAFSAVLTAVDANCELGRVSIVEGMPFSRVGEYEAVAELAARRGRQALAVLLEISPEVAAARIAAQQARGEKMADDRNSELPEIVNKRFRVAPSGALVLDATQAPDVLLGEVLTHLRSL
jgi:predicted kinase